MTEKLPNSNYDKEIQTPHSALTNTHLEVPDLLTHHPDPVEPEEEGDEGRQLVHHIRDLGQLVVAQIQYLKLHQVDQCVRQGGEGVLGQPQCLQVHQTTNLRGKCYQFVAVEGIGKCWSF